jgi:hypothetical protein
MTEAELIRLEFGYGRWLRNQCRQNKFPDLFRFCSAKTPPDTRSFDEISALAIREIWLHLRVQFHQVDKCISRGVAKSHRRVRICFTGVHGRRLARCLGEVEASHEATEIDRAAAEFKLRASKLMGARR